MAEYVESNLESMVPELEQLQRVQLFTKEEVRYDVKNVCLHNEIRITHVHMYGWILSSQVLKRRKRFEYKLQKQNKE